jgi:hypothetical protein
MVQNVSDRVFLVNAKSVPIEDLTKQGAKDVKVQYLIDEQHGSNRFSLRLYTVPKGGHTPLDQHRYEHQVYVLSGHGLLRETEQNRSVPRKLRKGTRYSCLRMRFINFSTNMTNLSYFYV